MTEKEGESSTVHRETELEKQEEQEEVEVVKNGVKSLQKAKNYEPPTVNCWNWLYVIDWTICMILMLTFVVGIGEFCPTIVQILPPGWMNETRYMYPLTSSTFPTWSFSIVVIVIIIIIIGVQVIRWFTFEEKIHGIHKLFEVVFDFHQIVLATCVCVALNSCITDSLKVLVGSYRPNYVAICQPDANGICQDMEEEQYNRSKSFPSGHSSVAFALCGMLAFYLFGKLKVFHKGGVSLVKVAIAVSPFILAFIYAVSRVWDYWHRPVDITAGSIIGLICALFSYLLYFPLFHKKECHFPRNRYGSLKDKKISKESILELLKY